MELAAALKNIIALGCGISDGMGYQDNTKALLMTRAMAEMARLGEKLGGDRRTFGGLAGHGRPHRHLHLHALPESPGRHPHRPGRERPAGHEGGGRRGGGLLRRRSACEQLAQREGVEMPICHCVYEVLYHGKPARDVVGELMNRSRKEESGRGWQYPN